MIGDDVREEGLILATLASDVRYAAVLEQHAKINDRTPRRMVSKHSYKTPLEMGFHPSNGVSFHPVFVSNATSKKCSTQFRARLVNRPHT